jgi:hypothetical protein
MNEPSVSSGLSCSSDADPADPVARLRGAALPVRPLAPGHLIAVEGGFGLWSQGLLRSSGFPIAGLLALGDDD